ncbi:hypothetical protein [Paludibaculum fermentans]|uniref:hypothetical protein n=1 Tax=Paludibaculum fermentans TaxID=1473598 RepID=UPI003EBBFF5F
MNCTLAAGILDTQVVSAAATVGVPAGQTQPGGLSFSTILGAQQPAEAVADVPGNQTEPQTSGDAAQSFTGHAFLIPESCRPICLYPQTAGPFNTDEAPESGTIALDAKPADTQTASAAPPRFSAPDSSSAPETRASRAFRLEQRENPAVVTQGLVAPPPAVPQPPTASKTEQSVLVVSNWTGSKQQAGVEPAEPLPAAEPTQTDSVKQTVRTRETKPASEVNPEQSTPTDSLLMQPGIVTPTAPQAETKPPVEPSRQQIVPATASFQTVAAEPAMDAKPFRESAPTSQPGETGAVSLQPRFEPQPSASTHPADEPAAASRTAIHTESQTLEEVSAPQALEPAPPQQLNDEPQTDRTSAQSTSSQLAQSALTSATAVEPDWAMQAATALRDEATAVESTQPARPVAPNPVGPEMHTALVGMLTLRNTEEPAEAAVVETRTPGAVLSLLKTAESDAISRRSFDTLPAEPGQPHFAQRPNTGEAYSTGPAVSNNSAKPMTEGFAAVEAPAPPATANPVVPPSVAGLKSTDIAPAARKAEQRSEKPVTSKPYQSTIAAADGPRVQTADVPVRQEAIRTAPGAEMTSRIEALQTAQAAVRGSVRSFTIPIGQDANLVATLRLVQQSTGVQITVQTPDAALSQSMQANLPQLLRGLEESGFKADFQTQPTVHTETTSAPVRTQSTDNRQSGSFDQGNPQQDGPAHGQGREKRQPSHEWRQWLQHGRKQNKEAN